MTCVDTKTSKLQTTPTSRNQTQTKFTIIAATKDLDPSVQKGLFFFQSKKRPTQQRLSIFVSEAPPFNPVCFEMNFVGFFGH